MKIHRLFKFFSGCLFFPAAVFASENLDVINLSTNSQKDSQPASTSLQEPEMLSDYYGYAYIGDNISGSPSNELKTINYKGGGPSEWGIGMGKYLNDMFSIDATFEFWGERYERKNGPILPGTQNNVIQAGGIGLSTTAVYNYTTGPLHSYAGLGVGYFDTGLLVTDPDSGLLTAINAPSDKWLPGYHISLGFDYRLVDNHKLGLEIKHRVLKADFGSYTNGEVDLGGTWLLIVYRASGL